MSDCFRCTDCNGSGNVSVRTGGYPEWDLETCQECGGTGMAEMYDACLDAEEFDGWEAEA